ncbi:MAG TPA: hypothetical protein VJI33_03455 [Candidatus Paceibacterota bacterium]
MTLKIARFCSAIALVLSLMVLAICAVNFLSWNFDAGLDWPWIFPISLLGIAMALSIPSMIYVISHRVRRGR